MISFLYLIAFIEESFLIFILAVVGTFLAQPFLRLFALFFFPIVTHTMRP